MKPYGLTKKQVRDSDDVVGIQEYGRKPSVGYFAGKGGDRRPRVKGSLKRKRIRRKFKRQARAISKNLTKQ